MPWILTTTKLTNPTQLHTNIPNEWLFHEKWKTKQVRITNEWISVASRQQTNWDPVDDLRHNQGLDEVEELLKVKPNNFMDEESGMLYSALWDWTFKVEKGRGRERKNTKNRKKDYF